MTEQLGVQVGGAEIEAGSIVVPLGNQNAGPINGFLGGKGLEYLCNSGNPETSTGNTLYALIGEGSLQDPQRSNAVLLITDGGENTECKTVTNGAEAAAKLLSQPLPVKTYVVGFSDAVIGSLAGIAEAGGTEAPFNANNPASLAAALTTIAAALAVGLVQRGHRVHLTTTDPAAHVAGTLDGNLEGLTLGRIDPRVETRAYIDKIMATRGKHLDEQGRALLLEDLQSPCTEEVAVFHAFSRVVNEARSAFVVLDTAPTGHSLLLIDATGAYHRQATHQSEGRAGVKNIITPLMRLQDATLTRVILVTLPEVTPVSQAAALQDDLRRASIEPWAWVINLSLIHI